MTQPGEKKALRRGRVKAAPPQPAGVPLGARAGFLLKYQLLGLLDMTEAHYNELTGNSADSLPEVVPPSVAPGVGVGSFFVPQPNWYYRALGEEDPIIADILRGADITPVKAVSVPAASPAEMTFRQTRAGGPKVTKGTDRISTASRIEAFQTTLAERGTGELVRIDVDAARRLGAEFLEHDTLLQHLDQVEGELVATLDKARTDGRGKNHLRELESRLESLRRARKMVLGFREGHGVDRVPSAAITRVYGGSLKQAAQLEWLFRAGLKFVRYGGHVMLFIGVIESVDDIASAPPDQKLRVATQEAGGWAFATAGAEVGAGVGAALGSPSGPGAIIPAALGALIGGVVGFVGGKEAADKLYDLIEDLGKLKNAGDLLSDTPRLLETMTLMFGSEEARRRFYELREMETGEPSPFGGF